MIFPVPPGTKRSYKSVRYSGGRIWGMSGDPMEIELTSGVGPKPTPAWTASNRNRSMDDERATYPKTDTTGAIAFLKALRPAGPWVLTAIWPDGPTTTQSFEASDEAGATRFIKDTNHAGPERLFHR